MDDEMPTDGCLLNVQFDPPLVFDGTPERCELNNRIAALLVERDRLAAEVAALPRSLTDPENQPSQWGTVPAADYNALAAEIARARAVLAHLSPGLFERARIYAEHEALYWEQCGADTDAAECRRDAASLDAAAQEMER